MNIREWQALRKQLKKLPLEQELRILSESLKKEHDKEILEKIRTEIQDVLKERDEKKQWKKTAVAPAPSLLVNLTQEKEKRQQERRETESPLETVVSKEQTNQENNTQSSHDYTPSKSQEYKGSSYESIFLNQMSGTTGRDIFEKPDYVPGRQEKFARSESERVMEAFDPLKSIETYKKKKDRGRQKKKL